MQKDMIFFNESGLTSTSANHIANLAKEYIQSLESRLFFVDFIKKEVGLLNSSDTKVLQEGTTSEELQQIPEALAQIADAKSLIAWLREAIKARERLVREVENTSLSAYCEQQGIEIPQSPEEPDTPHYLDEDEYLATLSIKERNRYYILETQCAVIGKYIHPDGAFAERRKELSKNSKRKHTLEGNGRDAILYTLTPSVNPQEVEDMFFALQGKHREYQAELNSIKFKMEKALTEDKITKQAEYNAEMQKYYDACAVVQQRVEALSNELALWKTTKVKEISSMKIVIPKDLLGIYNLITNTK